MTRASTIRLALLLLLFIVVLAGGTFGWALQRPLVAEPAAVTARLDRIMTAAMELGAAQEAYVGPGQPRQSWLERGTDLQRQLRDDVEAIGPLLKSPKGSASLQLLNASLEEMGTIDARIRDHLINGQDLSAADLIFVDARQAIASMTTSIGQLRDQERAAVGIQRAAIERYARGLLASAGALALLVLVVLLRWPADDPRVVEPALDLPEATVVAVPPIDETVEPLGSVAIPAMPRIDLVAAADVCSAISRLASSESLPGLLARAAVALDASGIIVWMGAGEELFAAAAHGYDERVMSRLGPIGRESRNATAAAWRTGDVQIVPADAVANGAIVAPMFGLERCVGVLAAEVREGGESDPTARAVIVMIAAQLAAVLSAWPAASTPLPVREQAS